MMQMLTLQAFKVTFDLSAMTINSTFKLRSVSDLISSANAQKIKKDLRVLHKQY